MNPIGHYAVQDDYPPLKALSKTDFPGRVESEIHTLKYMTAAAARLIADDARTLVKNLQDEVARGNNALAESHADVARYEAEIDRIEDATGYRDQPNPELRLSAWVAAIVADRDDARMRAAKHDDTLISVGHALGAFDEQNAGTSLADLAAATRTQRDAAVEALKTIAVSLELDIEDSSREMVVASVEALIDANINRLLNGPAAGVAGKLDNLDRRIQILESRGVDQTVSS